jgi:alkylated DNA repair dioxygenase AlkB
MADVDIAPVAEPKFERIQLDETSWVDVCRGWLQGADALYDGLSTGVAWQSSRLFKYDHWVEERRLGSMWTYGRPLPHPALAEVHKTLQRRYKVEFRGFGLIQYRDGRDGQAFHRDTDMKWLDDTLIPILTLGATRPWLLRPWSAKFRSGVDETPGKGATHDLQPGHGDLIVMGGRCQADWQHSVAYLGRQRVEPRISLQWRWTSRRGKPFQGGSYSAPLTYSR